MKLKLILLFIALLVSTTTVVAQLSQPEPPPGHQPVYDRATLTAEVRSRPRTWHIWPTSTLTRSPGS